MSLLRRWERDPGLPAACGDALRLPQADDVRELLQRTLVRPETPTLDSIELVSARWKPRVSLTSLHALRFAESTAETLVTVKTYLGAKARHVARFHTVDDRVRAQAGVLEPLAVLEDEGTCVWSFPADRRLRGLARVLDLKRTARWIDASGVFRPFVVRLRPSTVVVRRYKPERRAVLELVAKLRGPGDERHVRRAALRVLPVAHARRVIEARRQIQHATPAPPVPPLFTWEAETGVLLEPWIDGVAGSPGDFTHSLRAGALVARLHAIPCVGITAHVSSTRGALEVLGVAPHLVSAGVPEPAPLPATGWIHGDFHPDQVLLGDTPTLLDLDEARPGHPVEDLASWIADVLAEDVQANWRSVAEELLEGHGSGGGGRIDEKLLCSEVARQLVQRAAASMRRLERDALAKAGALLERARALHTGTGLRA